MESAIKIQSLTKNYGKNRGIEDINLEIKKGTVYGFIGPNGAGKSTTIKCIMNMIRKTSGKIYVDEKPIENRNNQIKEKIGYLPSEINLYDDLTVKKMLEYSASFYKKDCNSKIEKLVKKLDVDLKKKIDELSLGNLKKVGIILALMHDPEFIIMDEATSGLDPLMQEAFYEIIEEEKANGKTIFFSSHILSEVKRICEKVAIIKEGRIIRIEDISALERSHSFKIKLQSKDIKRILEELNLEKNVPEDNEKIEFIYEQDINKLITVLNKYKISKLLIEELEIEDIFMHYYK